MEKNILRKVWKDLEQKNNKIAFRVINWLDKDKMRGIILNDRNKYFYFESSYMPDYVYNYLIKYISKKYKAEYLRII